MIFKTHLVTGFVIGALGASVPLLSTANARAHRVTEAWERVLVVVAAVDLPVGTKLTMEMVSGQAIPRRYLMSSMVLADDFRAFVDRRISIRMAQGDPLLSSAFLTDEQAAPIEECLEAVRPALEHFAAETTARTVDTIMATATKPSRKASLVDAPGEFGVAVTRDLEANAILQPGDLSISPVPQALRTSSLVTLPELELVVGARLLVELSAGETLRWQMLDEAEAPSTPLACEVAVERALDDGEPAVARQAATEWLNRRPTR